MKMKGFRDIRIGFGKGDLPWADQAREILSPNFPKPTPWVGVRFHGRPSSPQRGKALPGSGHDVLMRLNLKAAHEEESYHA